MKAPTIYDVAREAGVDTWIASDQATHRRETGHFIRWAGNTS